MREKLIRSLSSSDLEDHEWETHIHCIASLGAAQIGPRAHLSIGAMLVRIRAGQFRFYPRVLALVKAVVQTKAKKGRWAGVTPQRASEIATIALERHFNPLCQVCNGVGKIGDFGQVIVLCSRANGGCGGSGKKAENWTGWREKTKDVLSMLGSWEGYASGGARRQARGDES